MKDVSVMVVTEVTERRGNYGGVVIDEDGNLSLLYITGNDRAVKLMKQDSYLSLGAVDISPIDDALAPPTQRIRITTRSKVCSCVKY